MASDLPRDTNNPKIYFPTGVKRISGMDIPAQRERNFSLLTGNNNTSFMKQPSVNPHQLQLTDGSTTLKPPKLPSLGKMPSLMAP